MNVLAVLIATSLAANTPPLFTAKTVEGRQVQGALADWNEQMLTLQEGDQAQELPLDQLLTLLPAEAQAASPRADAVEVTLMDGSVLVADSFLAEARAATVTTQRTGMIKLPPASVDCVRFREVSPALKERWIEIQQKPIDQDMLVVTTGKSLDYLGGIVRAIREKEIDFELDGDLVPVRRGKVFAVRYYRPDRSESGSPLAKLVDDGGSRWALQDVRLSESKGTIEAATGCGIRLSLPLQAIARVEFAGAGLVYLSDLEPDSYRWTPYFGREGRVPALEKFYRPRRDTALDSSVIKLDGIEYDRGVALHSRTEMTYRLPEPFERFQALAGIDDRLRPRGNVLLRILGDQQVLFEATVAGVDSALPIDISLRGVKTLTIVADFGLDLAVGDHLILAEARLLK